MTYKLFLDDVRDPPDDGWVIARSVADAQNYISKVGFPSFVSFDYDLGMTGQILSNGIWVGEEVRRPNGLDFVRWLCEQDRQNRWMTHKQFKYNIHSSNKHGVYLMSGFLQHYAMERTP